MIILLLLSVSVSLKGVKDEYFLFRYHGQFLQTLSLTLLLKKTTHCTITGRHGYFPNFQRYLLDFISKSVISSSPGIASGKNTDTMWCAEFFFRFFHSWRVYSFFSNFSYSTRLKVTSFLGFPQSTGKEVTRFCNFLKNLLGQITRFLEKSTRLGYSFFLTSNFKNE